MRLKDTDKHYLRMAMPAAGEGLFMVLLSSVDIIMVGVLGTAAIAAVSIFTQPRMNLPEPQRVMESYAFELSGGMRQRVGIAMAGGKVVEYGRTAAVIKNPQAAYTKALLSAVPEIGGHRYVE